MSSTRFSTFTHTAIALALCCVAQFSFAQKNIKVQVKNEQAVNTAGLDFSPTFYEDGIVFISTNNVGLKKITDEQLKLPAMSILRSKRSAEGALQAPEPFAKEISSEYHEGPVCFDRTAETVYFSRNVVLNGKIKTDKDGTQRMRLYTSKKTGGTWSDPVALPFNTNEFDDCHPAISIDGDKLFFASNRPGGLGGMDLYVAYRVGESWSEPVNLGPNVNTKGNEVFPFVHADNTLYFASSSGPGGKGGFDLYYTTPTGSNEWSKPVNLGEPFNTSGDDFGLIVDLDKINGYYSTNGAGGAGGDEIQSFYVENGNLDQYLKQQNTELEKYPLKVVVVDKRSGAPIEDATIRILSTEGGNVIGRDEAGNLITITSENGQDVMKALPPDKGIEGSTDYTGNFDTEVAIGNYAVTASKDGYQPKQATVTMSKPRRMVKIELDKGAMAGKARWNASLFNYATNAPLGGAKVIITDPVTGKKDTVFADANGMVDYYLDPNKKYKAEIYQGGRLIGSADVDTHGWATNGEPISQNFSVAPIMPGSAIQLPNIYYNFNDATLRPDAQKDLNMVVALMRQQPNLTVELASHTDCRGGSQYNQSLSQRRAEGVVEYLTRQGVDSKRLRPVGYGESEPRNRCTDGTNCTEQEHARNRRTEVRILAGMQAGSSMVYVDGQLSNSTGGDDRTPQSSTNVNVAPLNPGKAKAAKPDGKGEVTVTTSTEKDLYYVVAGSFLMENRANARLGELQQAGCAAAEIVRFPNSTFYSVSAGKFNNRKEAEALRRRLASDHKVDAFVRAVQ